jgi:hypothetical protein
MDATRSRDADAAIALTTDRFVHSLVPRVPVAK